MVSKAEREDPERVKVYDAQTLVDVQLSFDTETLLIHGQQITVPVMRKFGELEHIQTYVDHVLASDFVKRRWPKAASVKCTVRQRKSDAQAHWQSYHAPSGGPALAINRAKHGQSWAMQERTVLHELAHHCNEIQHRMVGRAVQGHGPEFRSVFLELLGEFCGAEVRWLHEIAFAEAGLKIHCCV